MRKSEQLRGFPIPEIVETEGTRCVAIQIPDHDDYHRALIAQVTMLGKWWKWEKTNPTDKHAARAAQEVRDKLVYTPVGESIPCEILDPEGGIIVTNVEEICEGVLCALGKAGQTLAAGINSGDLNFSIDENGNITIDETGGEGTQSEVAADLLFGDCKYVYPRIIEFMDDFHDFRADFPANPEITVEFMILKYLCTASINDAVDDYYAHIAAMNPKPQQPDDGLELTMYCEGITKQTVAAYVIDGAIADKILVLSMLDALSQDQYDQWKAENVIPRKGYESAPCYRALPQSYTMTFENWNGGFVEWYTAGISGHTVQAVLTVVEPFVDGDGDIYDGVWYKPSAGIPVSTNRMRLLDGASQDFPENIPAYLNGAGTYLLEYELEDVLKGTWFNNIASFVPVSGEIRITINDLGVF